jgi:hypothetical protein
VKDSLASLRLLFEKRWDDYAHSYEDDFYNEAPKIFLTKIKSNTLTSEDENPTVLWTLFWVVWCLNFQGA